MARFAPAEPSPWTPSQALVHSKPSNLKTCGPVLALVLLLLLLGVLLRLCVRLCRHELSGVPPLIPTVLKSRCFQR